LAKIAVELERAVAQRAATGGPGSLTSRLLGQGDGWHVADVVCTCGPQDRRFEEQHPFFTIAVVVAGTFQYRGSLNGSGLAEELMTPGSLLLGNAGQSFECGHEHGLGDRCLSFRYSRDYFERVAAEPAKLPRAAPAAPRTLVPGDCRCLRRSGSRFPIAVGRAERATRRRNRQTGARLIRQREPGAAKHGGTGNPDRANDRAAGR